MPQEGFPTEILQFLNWTKNLTEFIQHFSCWQPYTIC